MNKKLNIYFIKHYPNVLVLIVLILIIFLTIKNIIEYHLHYSQHSTLSHT